MNRKIKLPPSHSTLSAIAAEGRKAQGGEEYRKSKIM